MHSLCPTAKFTLIYMFLQHNIGSWLNKTLYPVLRTWERPGPSEGAGHSPLGCKDTQGRAEGCGPCSRWPQHIGDRLSQAESPQLDHEEEKFLGSLKEEKEKYIWLSFICLEGNHQAFLSALLLPTFWPLHCSLAPPTEGEQKKGEKMELEFIHLRC